MQNSKGGCVYGRGQKDEDEEKTSRQARAGMMAAPRLRIFLSPPELTPAIAAKEEGMRLGRKGLADLKRQPS